MIDVGPFPQKCSILFCSVLKTQPRQAGCISLPKGRNRENKIVYRFYGSLLPQHRAEYGWSVFFYLPLQTRHKTPRKVKAWFVLQGSGCPGRERRASPLRRQAEAQSGRRRAAWSSAPSLSFCPSLWSPGLRRRLQMGWLKALGTVRQQLNPLEARGRPPFWPRRAGGSRVPRWAGASPLEAFRSERRGAVGRSAQTSGVEAQWGSVSSRKGPELTFLALWRFFRDGAVVPFAAYPRFLLILSSLWESLREQNTYWGNELALRGSALGLFQAVKHGHMGLFFKFLVPLRCNEPCLRALYADHLNLL